MDGKFVIVEVLTSADYYAAAEALEREAAGYEEGLGDHSLYSPSEEEDLQATIDACRARAKRFKNVATQVREQEAKTHGL